MGGLAFFRFYLARVWRHSPPAVAMVLLAMLCCAVAGVSLAWWLSRSDAVAAELAGVRRMSPTSTNVQVPRQVPGVDLAPLNSAQFTVQFQAIARDVGLSTDEIFYVLESAPAQPYLRYRITLDAKAGYPEVRKFIAALAAEQPHVALDAIRCRRDDAGAASLVCQLAFSAFFSKAHHG